MPIKLLMFMNVTMVMHLMYAGYSINVTMGTHLMNAGYNVMFINVTMVMDLNILVTYECLSMLLMQHTVSMLVTE